MKAKILNVFGKNRTRGMSFKVMQIEVSNECSLECAYCPHPSQIRPKGNMTFETFKKCIDLVTLSDNPEIDGRKFLWLNHFGEPLLNPMLPSFISYAESKSVEVSFATNGVDYQWTTKSGFFQSRFGGNWPMPACGA
jgi:sulfatase maturation enzyme AslB (radical SAM superfamily)